MTSLLSLYPFMEPFVPDGGDVDFIRRKALQVEMWTETGLSWEEMAKRLDLTPGQVVGLAVEGRTQRRLDRYTALQARKKHLAWLRKSTIAVKVPRGFVGFNRDEL